MWQQVAPTKGEAPSKVAWIFMTAAGLFRAVTVSALWLVSLSVATRTRAGVALIVVVLVIGVGEVAHLLTTH